MPVFSQEAVAPAIEDNKTLDLAKHVQNADTDMINADGNKGSVNLSMAYASALARWWYLGSPAGGATSAWSASLTSQICQALRRRLCPIRAAPPRFAPDRAPRAHEQGANSTRSFNQKDQDYCALELKH